MKYTIEVKWSDEDNCYVVLLPEFADQVYQPVADGKTYEEAMRRGHNALENIIATLQEEGIPLPAPQVYISK